MSSGEIITLGPVGTHTMIAAREMAPSASLRYEASIEGVLDRVAREAKANPDTNVQGVVPLYNSTHGMVTTSFDGLYEAGFSIHGETILPIRHALCGLPGVLADVEITEINSHPQALAQCRDYLADRFPGVKLNPTTSTAVAMQKIKDGDNRSALAIGSEIAATEHGLEVIEADIEDVSDNMTRFALFGRAAFTETVMKSTLVAITLGEDRPGSLDEVLRVIGGVGVNLKQIDSRPVRESSSVPRESADGEADDGQTYRFYIRLALRSDDMDRYGKIEDSIAGNGTDLRRITALPTK